MEWASKRSGRVHFVVCLAHGKSHVAAALTLAAKLASLDASITIVWPSRQSSQLLAEAAAGEDWARGLDMVSLSLEDVLPDGGYDLVTTARQDPADEYREFVHALQVSGLRTGIPDGFQLRPKLSRREEALQMLLQAMQSPPACVIVDMALDWAESVIAKLGIPRFVFFPGTPASFPLVLHLRSLFQTGALPISHQNVERKKQMFDGLQVEGLPMLFSSRDVPDATIDSSHTMHETHMNWVDHIRSSDGLLFNTFTAFEPCLLDALRSKFPKKMILPVGPLGEQTSSMFPSSQETKCQEWLDAQAPASVVYVSFGSWARLLPEQILELAAAFERLSSCYGFLWLVPDSNQVLPQGYVERNRCKMLVLSEWAPQKLILAHPSTGAFLSHCGWNSTLECVVLAGVPIICWPFMWDQPPNCRHLVDGVKLAVEVSGDDKGFVSSEEVEGAVRRAMSGEEAEGMKERAKALQAAAKAAMQPGGEQGRIIQAFVSSFTRNRTP